MAEDHAPAAGPGRVSPREALKSTGPVTLLSVGVASVLCAIKLAGFLASGSIALLASLADSALDLAASLVTFFAVRYAAEPADQEHRYGHGKAEAFAALFQALLVAASSVLILREAAARLMNPEPIAQGGFALGVMVVSVLLTLGLVSAQNRVVAKTGSLAVSGDRAHYLADLGGNGAAMAGVALAAFGGLGWADAVIGAGIAAWLAFAAWVVAKGALDQMMDRELADADRARIRSLACEDGRLLRVDELRTRASGPLIHVQFSAELPAESSLREAHDAIVAAEERIMAVYPAADVLIHPHPAGAAAHGQPHLAPAEDETPQ